MLFESLTGGLRHSGEHVKEGKAAQWNVDQQYGPAVRDIVTITINTGGRFCSDW